MGKVYFIRKKPEDVLEENRKVLEEIKRISAVSAPLVFKPTKNENEHQMVEDHTSLDFLDKEMPEFHPTVKMEDSQVNLGSISTNRVDMQGEEILKLGKALKVKKGK